MNINDFMTIEELLQSIYKTVKYEAGAPCRISKRVNDRLNAIYERYNLLKKENEKLKKQIEELGGGDNV